MPPTWLNHYVNSAGVWTPPDSDTVELVTPDRIINPPGASVRLYETSRSGYVTLAPTSGQLETCGDAEVFVYILHTNNFYEYLSAPLSTPVEVANVALLRLGIVAPVGPMGANGPVQEVRYRVVVNAHLVYEVLP
jgi:hypothetical protein